jgi:phosphoribosylformimino-5-aminoimidazole carboxamide ribotide isomerase
VIIIPAVDIRQGKCVRLLQGRQDAETIFSDDPAAMALRWAEIGARLIHVIDLDGAFNQRPKNLQAIKKIIGTIDAPIQVGGGIRDMKTIQEYMTLGVGKVIIGTEAIRNPDLVKRAARDFPGRVVVAIDARNGKVAIEGWTETTRVSAVDLAKKFEDCGVSAINFTDIHRDGMQTGPNIDQTRRLAEAITVPVVASGGVSTLKDIENLLPLETVGVTGVITGKALYSGSLDLKAAIALSEGHVQSP